jgi:proteasome lid subunit RPN8/RPN11
MLNPRAMAKSDSTMLRGKAFGTWRDDACQVVIAESALESVVDYSEHDLHRELGGFLLGHVPLAGQRMLEISDFLPAVGARSQAASLTFTHDTWAAMTREVDDRFPDLSVVGWHHTHPGFGVFLSGYDMFIHRHFFRAPWQVALVVDPQRQELGFFQWQGDRVAGCGFFRRTNDG